MNDDGDDGDDDGGVNIPLAIYTPWNDTRIIYIETNKQSCFHFLSITTKMLITNIKSGSWLAVKKIEKSFKDINHKN